MRKNYKNIRNAVLGLALMCTGNTYAQTQTKTFEWAKHMPEVGTANDVHNPNDITTDAAGNSYIVGHFQATVDMDPSAGVTTLTSAGSNDIFISKYDPLGNLIWAKSMGSTGSDVGLTLELDAQENILITGYFLGTVDFDLGTGVANLTSTAIHYDGFIAKYDANGNYIWAKNLASSAEYTNIQSLDFDSTGNIIVSGFFAGTVDFDFGVGVTELTATTPTGYDGFIAKYDASGNFIWVKQIGDGVDNEQVMNVVVNPYGEICVSGIFYGTTDFDPSAGTFTISAVGGGWNTFIAKYDSLGNYMLAKGIGGAPNTSNTDLAIDREGGFIITGMFNDGDTDFDPGTGTALLNAQTNDGYVAKYDSAGNYIWAYDIGANLNDGAYGVITDTSNNVYVTGTYFGTYDFDPGVGSATLTANYLDMYIVKYDALGNYIWVEKPSSTGTSPQETGHCIAIDNSNNILLAGRFRATISAPYSMLSGYPDFDMLTAKYSQCVYAEQPTISATDTTVCSGNTTVLSINSGVLNDAVDWQWYTGSCGGTLVGTGSSITVTPLMASPTYYVRGEGGCTTIGTCESFTVNFYDTPMSLDSIVCPNDTIILGSQTITMPGTYTETFTGINCDSIVIYNVQHLAMPAYQNVEVCNNTNAIVYGSGDYYWYDSPTATTELAIANSYTTPLLVNSQVYYVETANYLLTSGNIVDTVFQTVDHDATTGDDRCGIAITQDYFYIVGDNNTARMNAMDLTNQVSLPIRDGIFSDLGSGKLYTMSGPSGPPNYDNGISNYTFDRIVEMDSMLNLTGNEIILSSPITGVVTDGDVIEQNGIFAGPGFMLFFHGNQSQWYKIETTTGNVEILGTTVPQLYWGENWADWGYVEVENGITYAVYENSGWPSSELIKMDMATGLTTIKYSFTNVSDMANITYSPWHKRHYFHYEGGGQFGGTSETGGWFGTDSTGTLGYESVGCRERIDVTPIYPNVNLGADTTVCNDRYVLLDGGVEFIDYSWSDGSVNQMNIIDGGGTLDGDYTYSVIVTDTMGCTNTDEIIITFGSCVGIDELTEMTVRLFPNPANDVINLDFSSAQSANEITIELYNLTGSKIISKQYNSNNGTLTLDVSEIPSGVYFVSIMIDDVVKTKKVIIE